MTLWDAASGRKVWESAPLPQFNDVWKVVFSPDGRQILTGGSGLVREKARTA